MTTGLRIVRNPPLLTVPVRPQPAIDLADVLTALEAMPVQRSAALAVMRVLDDPTCDANGIARTVSADPALATRLLRTANSAFFGLSGRVRDLPFAITVLGTITVRSLAAAAAAEIGDDNAPEGFWLTGSRRAAGAALVAPRLGCRKDDAFCAALLAELGFALLHRIDPIGYPELGAAAQQAATCPVALEQARYGIDHAAAAGRVLAAWRFPQELCDAVATSHDRGDPASPLSRAVRAGACLAARLPGSIGHDPADAEADRLGAALVTPDELPAMLEQTEVRASALAAALA